MRCVVSRSGVCAADCRRQAADDSGLRLDVEVATTGVRKARVGLPCAAGARRLVGSR